MHSIGTDFDQQAADTTASRSSDNTTPEPGAFAQFGLAPSLVQAISDLGYQQPTKVQLRAIPLAMYSADAGTGEHGGHDLMVSSQTGSGKTAAFLLPVLHTLISRLEARKAEEKAAFDQMVAEALAQDKPAPKKPKRKNPLNRRFEPAVPGALILCPTRELAMQVARDAIDLLPHARGVRVATVIGGLPYPKQIAQLQNANLIVATPGRLLDLQNGGHIILDQVEFLVVDEADRMLDLGFADDLEAIHRLTEGRKQTMMFSATFAPRIQQLGMRVMRDRGQHVQRIDVASAQEKHANITQKLFWADDPRHKRELLDTWLRDTAIDQAIVFASTQIECDELAADLQQTGFNAVALHGALNQGLRNRRLSALRDGRVQLLVATDVAARGIDVPTITHVFNYGLPMKAEDYTHRIGRTGRAGRDGLAISFAEFKDRRRIHDIEQFTRQMFEVATLPGLEPSRQFSTWKPNTPASRGARRRPDGRRNSGFSRGDRAPAQHSDGYRNDGYRSEGHRSEGYRSEGHRNEGHRSGGADSNWRAQPAKAHAGHRSAGKPQGARAPSRSRRDGY